MESIVLISVGLITQFLNFIEIWLLIKKSKKSPFEIILLSLAFADFLAGTSTLLLGILHLLYLLPSIAESDMFHILYITANNITVSSLMQSLIHVYLFSFLRDITSSKPIYISSLR